MTISLETIRSEHEAAKLQRETAKLRAETLEYEQVSSVLESYGGIVPRDEYPGHDGWHSLFGSGSQLGAMLGDRAGGANPPTVRTEVDLTDIRAAARWLHDTNTTARNALQTLTNYCLGGGFRCKAAPSAVTQKTPQSQELAAECMAVIRDFSQRNKWRDREREAFRRLHRDGEVFTAMYHIGGGRAALRYIEPCQVTEPENAAEVERRLLRVSPSCWAFGIHTDDDDTESVHGYWVKTRTRHRDIGRYYPAEITSGVGMLHHRRNVDANIKRGISDFYPVRELLENASKLLRNTVIGSAMLAAIAMIRQHANSTQAQATGMIASNAWSRGRVSTPLGSQQQTTQCLAPGSILDISRGLEYKPSPLAAQGVGAAMVEVQQAALRIIGSNWAMPEVIISGDTGNTSYSSALVAEAPFTKFCQCEQAAMKEYEADVYWAALKIAYDAGRFDRYVDSWDELQQMIDLTIAAPIIESRDRNIETNRRKILHDNGIIAAETWSSEEGYDYEHEQEAGAKTLMPSTDPFPGGDQAGFPQSGLPKQTGATPLTKEQRVSEARRLLWNDYPFEAD